MNTDFAAQNQLANFQAQIANSQSYTDLADLNSIKQQAKSDGQGALREVAEQFESIFLNMVLKSMRAANEAFEEDGVFNSQQSKMYRDMYDQQISLSLTQGPGIGMADMLVKQLGGYVERNQQLSGSETRHEASLNLQQKQGLQAYQRSSRL
ncbi:Flagellar protein FlgJ [gamma proteobacterium IMCC2047]|nr:Flagellar protein FlgJ [gamma proteobacterium IMCC2047]